MTNIEDKIAKLLAKAESTNHPAEAESFMAKAEELMLKHGIERAMLAEASPAKKEEIVTVRITIPNGHGYATAMAAVAYACAPSFSVRTLRSRTHAGAEVVWLIGHRSDVAQVETLANSLMGQSREQATFWWKTEGKAAHPGATKRDVFYCRREFIYAFANGVRARLEETRDRVVNDAAPGTGLVLVERGKQVDNWIDENMTVGKGRSTSRKSGGYEARVAGKAAGREAVNPQAVR